MKILGGSLVTLLVGLLLTSPAFGGWKDKIVFNQFKALEYIEKLQNGADPDIIERPYLRYDERAKANSANKEIRAAMERAEELARQGRHDLIEIPEFEADLVSNEYREQLNKEYNERYPD